MICNMCFFKSAQLIAATFVQGNHDIHDDLCKYKAQSLHVFYKCWSAAELIAAKSDMMSAEQKKSVVENKKKDSLQSSEGHVINKL